MSFPGTHCWAHFFYLNLLKNKLCVSTFRRQRTWWHAMKNKRQHKQGSYRRECHISSCAHTQYLLRSTRVLTFSFEQNSCSWDPLLSPLTTCQPCNTTLQHKANPMVVMASPVPDARPVWYAKTHRYLNQKVAIRQRGIITTLLNYWLWRLAHQAKIGPIDIIRQVSISERGVLISIREWR